MHAEGSALYLHFWISSSMTEAILLFGGKKQINVGGINITAGKIYVSFLSHDGGKSNIQHFNYIGHLPTLFVFPFEGHWVMRMSSSTCNSRDVPILTAVSKAYTNASWKSD